MTPRLLRIGVDVGGTNTDGVILDPSRSADDDRGILAWHKSPTTRNPSLGINNAITTMFEEANISAEDVASVTIGTTHFVNAVVEMDQSRLAKVAILRLCGPFSKHAPPCIDWPDNLRKLICGHYALLKGGLEVDGDLISDIVEEEILEQCKIIADKGISSIVVNGIFSPIDTLYMQEERAAEIIRKALPKVDIVLSKEVANLGFLERENAAILNASILPFARKTIKSFQQPIKKLGLKCPLFIAQNDGTVLLAKTAARLPIRTFSSGPTNSMRGAAFLVGTETKENLMVVDIGGTTTDVGLLQANGFPRQAAAFSEICGVRMNFSCPDVKSIGLGGGSIVRRDSPNGKMTVGPDSVGYQIQTKALVFGGEISTTTDYTVAADKTIKIGRPELVKDLIKEEDIGQYKQVIKQMLEKVIDTMKTSPEDLPVLLVGGGAVIAPDVLKGASKVLKPKWSGVANAIGAAIARVSAVIDTVESTETKTTKQLIEEISIRAIDKAVEGGAARDSVKIVEIDTFPLQYIASKSRIIVRAAGDFDLAGVSTEIEVALEEESIGEVLETVEMTSTKEGGQTSSSPIFDILSYKPIVKGREWIISEVDLDWISIGCYILGTGGGGSPYSSMLRLRDIIRKGGIVRVVNPNDLKDDDLVGCGGGAGSPTVGIEKLQGDQMMEAQHELYELIDKKATHMIALEIGGGNGLQGMILGASTMMNIPTVDGDWMGRAYPVKWQTTPVVFEQNKAVFLPSVMCDGNGNVVSMTKATSDLMCEKVFRAGLSQLGSSVGCAEGPVTGADTKKWVVEHTISLSWRIGRAVAKARQFNQIDNVAESIIDEVGGDAKVLFKGKIIGCDRTLRMGHVYGEVIIEGADTNEPVSSNGKKYHGKMKIPFKNENIAAYQIEADGSETVVGIVPDLICVIDAQNGEAIGTPEYRYGLLVIVIGIVASEKWTSTPRGIEFGGPEGFGMKGVEYLPLGKFQKPRSVIDEFAES